MLLFELIVIRWISSELRIFAYFHNLVLVFCFLGIGFGCALYKRKMYLWLPYGVIALFSVNLRLAPYFGLLSIRRISTYIGFGTDYVIWLQDAAPSPLVSMLSLVAGLFLLLISVALIAACFIPFGQLLGRHLEEATHPLRAYGMNLAGSLAGILVFNALSFFWTPPSIWFAVGGVGFFYFMRTEKTSLAIAFAALVLAVISSLGGGGMAGDTYWSPYQKLSVQPGFVKVDNQHVRYGWHISVNGIGYQQMTNYAPEFVNRFARLFPLRTIPYDQYNLPFRFTKNSGDVLIVGAGSGNDAAGAIRN